MNDAWLPREIYFAGIAEQAVDISPLSPKVNAATLQQVSVETAQLRDAGGDQAFRMLFCGPLKANYVYRQTNGNGSVVTHMGMPEWVELDTPVQINPTHYLSDSDTFLGPNDVPSASDCLWGTSLDSPGEALIAGAYPEPFHPDRIFNSYLLEGIELFPPMNTQFGTIKGTETNVSKDGFHSGDRFFESPEDLPICDGTQWAWVRAECDSTTMTTPIVYSFVRDTENKQVYCGTRINNLTGKIQSRADLPFIGPEDPLAPPCDHLPMMSTLGNLNLVVIATGVLFNLYILAMYHSYGSEDAILDSQPKLVCLMAGSGLVLCLSFVLLLEDVSEEVCVARTWSLNLSFVFMLSILWAKVYQNFVILAYSKKRDRFRASSTEIIRIAVQLMMIDVTIITVWTCLDPPRVVSRSVSFSTDNGIVLISRRECGSNSQAFLYITFFYKALLVLTNCILVNLQRNVPEPWGPYLPFWCVYMASCNTALLLAAGVFLGSIVQDMMVSYTIDICGGVFGTIVLVGAIAYPPLNAARKQYYFSMLSS